MAERAIQALEGLIEPPKDYQFEVGNIIKFIFLDKEDKFSGDINNSFIGIVVRLEGRYLTIDFATKQALSNEVTYVRPDRSMTVKLNGYSKFSIVSNTGVTEHDMPLADIVNIGQSIIIKNVLPGNNLSAEENN